MLKVTTTHIQLKWMKSDVFSCWGPHGYISRLWYSGETLDAVSEDLGSSPSMATRVLESTMNKIWHIVGLENFTVPSPINGYSVHLL